MIKQLILTVACASAIFYAGAIERAPGARGTGMGKAVRMEQPAEAQTRAERVTAQTMPKGQRLVGNVHYAPERLGASVPVMRVLGDGTTLYGSVIYSDAWAGRGVQYGIYSFTASSAPSPKVVVPIESYDANGGGTYADGKYYYNSYVYTDEMGYTFSTFLTYDFATGNLDRITRGFLTQGFDQSQITHDMAYDPTTGTIYAIGYIKVVVDSEGLIERFRPSLSTVDTFTGMVSPIAETPAFIAIAVNRAGELYGITKGASSALYRINKTTADCTEIGPTGLNPEYVQSAAFDPVTDKLYWAATEITGTTGLYEVDVTTGAASKIASFPNNEEFAGIYIPEPETVAGAPAAAENMTTSFAGGSLKGTIAFAIPSKTVGGTALSGNVTVDITVDGEAFASFEAQAGAQVSRELELAEGVHNYAVALTNTAGTGPRKGLSWYVGLDAPAAVGNPQVTVDSNDTPVVSWTAPVAGRNDGYIDPAQITYTVVRQPEGVEVARGISATTCYDRTTFAAQNAWYEITPYIGHREGLTASTPTGLYGHGSELPVTFGFDTQADFDLCTVIDANQDYVAAYHWGSWLYAPSFSYTASEGQCAVYSFSPENAADDWLIMPPFTAENGKRYRVTFTMWTRGDKETLEVTAGPQNTVEVQKTILAAKEYNHKDKQVFTAEYTATSSGNSYVGFHITSPKKRFYLFIDDVTIDEVPDTSAPAAVGALTVAPAPKGELKATLSFTAPVLNAGGSPLTTISRIDIFRGNDNTVIHSIASPAPGAALTWTDTEPQQGFNTYRVVAANAGGQGEKAVATAYVGYDVPTAVTDLVLVEENGYPVLKWKAPVTGQNGGYINPDELVYLIRRNDGSLLTNKATGTSFTDASLNPSLKQYFIYYQVEPVSVAGIGDYALTNHIIFGDPYEGPFSESFSDVAVSTDPWVMYKIKGTKQLWTLMSQGYSPVCAPADSDGGIAVFESTSGRIGDEGRMVSPKLNLSGFDIPVFSFAFYHYPSYDTMMGEEQFKDRLIPEVQLPDGTFEALDEAIYVDDPTVYEGWYLYSYDLSKYKDLDYVQLSFHGIADYSNDINIDVVSVSNQVEYDLGVYSFGGPASIKAGKDARYKITLANNGANPATDYKINLMRDGAVLQTINGGAIPAQHYGSFEFTVPSAISEEGKTYTYQAVVDWNNDKISGNNKSETVTTRILAPDMPQILSVDAELQNGNNVSLAWSAPSALHVNDDMEGYTPFTIDNIGDYTLVDVDGGYTYGFQDIYYDNAGAPCAFMVFNAWQLGIAQILPEWDGHSGHQVLAAFSAVDADGNSIAADDWLISPEIHGSTTLSFYAKTANYEWGLEEFEVLYSTTDNNTASFRSVDGVITAQKDWTLYTYELPLTAKYFAIRYRSTDKFIFYLDDLKYTAKASLDGFDLTGYRVYRNGVALTDLPASTTSFNDPALAEGRYTYKVAALYGQRESGTGDGTTVVVGNVGIGDGVSATAACVETDGRHIVVTGAAGEACDITDAAGLVVYRGEGCDTYRAEVAPGVYMVRVGASVTKVVVK